MLYVVKFGGSSISNSISIEKLVKVIINKNTKYNYIIVISAIKNIRDKLIECAYEAKYRNKTYQNILQYIENYHIEFIHKNFSLKNQSFLLSFLKKNLNKLEILYDSIYQLQELSKKSLDKIMSFGEIISSYLIFNKLKETNINISWIDSRSLIKTDRNFGCGQVDFDISNNNILKYIDFNRYKYIIVPGFIASTLKNETITLGKGGSNYTAAILAAACQAKNIEIWTNVNGLMTADPNIVSQAFCIKNISYEEALEISYFGAKVIDTATIKYLFDKQIPIKIKNILNPLDSGTYIFNKKCTKSNINEPITGISGLKSIALLTIEGIGGMNSLYYYKRIFDILYYENINIIFITQSSSEYSITIGISEKEITKAIFIINNEFKKEIYNKQIKPINIDQNLCLIAIIGDYMKNIHGTSGKIFYLLGKNGINIRAISQGSTEKNISIIIKKIAFHKALNILHESLFEKPIKQINLFLIGLGKVGSKLIEQINKQKIYIQKKLKLQINFIGIGNSKKMFFNEKKCINIEKWQNLLEKGEDMNIDSFINKVINLNLRNSLFIDNTANKNVAMIYENFLKKGIGVITCNKIACSSEYKYYKNLKKISHKFNSPFLFETNVGAGLPIISTLNDLINSGDKIIKIEAVLSGSLNFIFNHFNKDNTFANVVKIAQKKGYTEPDPRIDLSGIDVMRKILILARECGSNLEIQDIEFNNFLPINCMNTNSIDDFYEKLVNNSYYFDEIRKHATKNNKHLKFIAKYNNGKVFVGLEHIDNNHPFYNLKGKDNMILYFTKRYFESPLIIKGAGAGSEVTASGIFSDIIKASR